MFVLCRNHVSHTPLLRCATQEFCPPLQKARNVHSYTVINLTHSRDTAVSQQFTSPAWFCLTNMTEHLCSLNH